MKSEANRDQACWSRANSTWGLPVRSLPRRLWLGGLATLAGFVVIGFAGQAHANLPSIDLSDTNVTVVATGGINPLITRVWDLPLNTFPRAPFLSFSFAFETQETARDGQILDSATFFIQNLSQTKVSILATVDANGVTWLPGLDGAVPIPAYDLTHEALPFPNLQPLMAIRTSQYVTLQIPAVYFPEAAQFVFQMFDYPNGYNSVGVVTPPYLYLVPEPTPMALGNLGLAILLISRRIFRSTSCARTKL